MGPTERLALPWGNRPAVYKTAAVAAEPRRLRKLPIAVRQFPTDRRLVAQSIGNRKSAIGNEKWWAATVPPRALRFKRPLHRCNACDPKIDCERRGGIIDANPRPPEELVRQPGVAPGRTGWKPAMLLFNITAAKWNPVLESHQPLRCCRPPPELLGQRDSDF